MKITNVSYKSYRWPLATPIRNGKHIYPEAGLNVIQIDTECLLYTYDAADE